MRIYPHADQPSIAPPAVAQPVPTARFRTLVFIGVVLGAVLLSGVGSGLFASSFTASGRAPTSPHSSLAISSPGGEFHPSAARTASSNTTHADGAWVRLAPVQPSTPGARVYSSLVYDTVDRSLVLFGGWSPKIGPLGDTWVFSAGSWTNLTSTLSSAPSPRYGATAVSDPVRWVRPAVRGDPPWERWATHGLSPMALGPLLSNSSSISARGRARSRGLPTTGGSSGTSQVVRGADMQGNLLNDADLGLRSRVVGRISPPRRARPLRLRKQRGDVPRPLMTNSIHTFGAGRACAGDDPARIPGASPPA